MRYTEFKRLLGKAGISGKEFSKLVKLNPNSLSNYAKKGSVPTHWAIIATLISEMEEEGLDFRHSISKLDITPNCPRGAAVKNKFFNTTPTTKYEDKK